MVIEKFEQLCNVEERNSNVDNCKDKKLPPF